jgi:hypothetical protein
MTSKEGGLFMLDHTETKAKIREIVSEVDNLGLIDLLNEFARQHPDYRKVLASLTDKNGSDTSLDVGELVNKAFQFHLLDQPIHKSIVSMHGLFKVLLKWMDTFRSALVSDDGALKEYLSKVPDFSLVLEYFAILYRAVREVESSIKKERMGAIGVYYGHSKETIKREFNGMLNTVLPKSEVYNERMQTRLPSEETLKNYLKVWKLRDLGLTFEDIVLNIKVKSMTSAVQKQFYKAFEIIYGEKYDKNRYLQGRSDPKGKGLCDVCPEKVLCNDGCPKLKAHLKSLEMAQKELPIEDPLYGGPLYDKEMP